MLFAFGMDKIPSLENDVITWYCLICLRLMCNGIVLSEEKNSRTAASSGFFDLLKNKQLGEKSVFQSNTVTFRSSSSNRFKFCAVPSELLE